MKKIIVSILTIILMSFVFAGSAYAAQLEATVVVTPDKTEVEAGEKVTFTVTTTNIANADNNSVSAIMGILEWDPNFFEIPTDVTGTMTLNPDTGDFNSMTPVTEGGTNGTIILKVKDDATGTGTVKFTNLEVSDGRIDAEGTATTPDQSIDITIADPTGGENPNPDEKVLTEIKIDAQPTKVEYVEGEKFDKTGMKVIAVYSDDTTKEITDYTYTPNGELAETDTEITITYTEGGVTKTVKQAITVEPKDDGNPDPDPGAGDDKNPGGEEDPNQKPGQDTPKGEDPTTADTDIPKAGINAIILMAGIVISVVAIIFYKKNQSFRDIK